MNLPTILGALVVLFVFGSIVARGIYNKKHHKSNCGCSCGDCPSKGMCHPDK